MKFFIHTYGCQMNERDSEGVAADLLAQGHELAADEQSADLVIVNTCSIREKAEQKAIGKLQMLARDGIPHIGVMGCMVSRLGDELYKLVPRLEFTMPPNRHSNKHIFQTPRQLSSFVTVLHGCNRRCAYCIVPDVRGPEVSRTSAEILAECREVAENGIREITLIGQSVLNYRGDVSFPRLLALVSEIPEIARIRFASSHPSGCTEELAAAMRDLPKVCHHMHMAVQSGSDTVLKRMRRGYDAAGYLAAVERLRAAVPDIAITSDIIVGFPGETDADFEATRELMRAANFDNTFIFKYSPRPGTPSAAWEDDVPTAVKEERNQILLADQDILGTAHNNSWIGREVEVLAEGPSLRNPARWAGRSSQNKVVIFDPAPNIKRGDLINVKITRSTPQTLFA